MTYKYLIIIGFTSILLGVGTAQARDSAPISSLRPLARSAGPAVTVPPTEQAVDEAIVQPKRRGLFRSLRPNSRGEKVELRGRKARRAAERGKVCGDRDLQGEFVGRVPGKLAGCGLKDAVRVRSVSGVVLSQSSIMDCTTAKALKTWIEKGLVPAVKGHGGGVASLRVVAHYSCRTRNSQKGAKISEHGKGRAIDIAGIKLKNGNEISVLKDWSNGRKGRILHQSHKAACGPFGTVLGPNANRFHRDHFHFDTARYRSGSYCK